MNEISLSIISLFKDGKIQQIFRNEDQISRRSKITENKQQRCKKYEEEDEEAIAFYDMIEPITVDQNVSNASGFVAPYNLHIMQCILYRRY